MDTLNNHRLSQLYPNSIPGVSSRTLQLAPITRFCDYPHFTVESTETWSGRATCQHHNSAAFPTLFPPTSRVCNAPAKWNPPLSLESRISCLWAFALIISIYLGSVSYHYLQYCCPLPESFLLLWDHCCPLVGGEFSVSSRLYVLAESSQEHEQDRAGS